MDLVLKHRRLGVTSILDAACGDAAWWRAQLNQVRPPILVEDWGSLLPSCPEDRRPESHLLFFIRFFLDSCCFSSLISKQSKLACFYSFFLVWFPWLTVTNNLTGGWCLYSGEDLLVLLGGQVHGGRHRESCHWGRGIFFGFGVMFQLLSFKNVLACLIPCILYPTCLILIYV